MDWAALGLTVDCSDVLNLIGVIAISYVGVRVAVRGWFLIAPLLRGR